MMNSQGLSEATQNTAHSVTLPDVSGIFLNTVIGVLAPLWPYLLLGLAAVALIAWAKRKLKPKTKAQRQHAYNEKRSWEDLKLIRSMAPLENPARVFAYLRKVDPYRFEEMILSELARRNLRIVRGESYSGDGGIDGQFYLGKQLWLIQAKRYGKFIKQEHVWALDSICQRRKAKGLFVHTGKTPEALRQMQRQCGEVRIISGEELLKFFAGHAVSLALAEPKPVAPLEAGRPVPAASPAPAPKPAAETIFEGAIV